MRSAQLLVMTIGVFFLSSSNAASEVKPSIASSTMLQATPQVTKPTVLIHPYAYGTGSVGCIIYAQNEVSPTALITVIVDGVSRGTLLRGPQETTSYPGYSFSTGLGWLPALDPGSHTVTCTFAADANNASGTATVTENI